MSGVHVKDEIVSEQVANLNTRALRGGFFTTGGQGVKFVVSILSTVVLARLLTPADYGLVAMVMSVTGFVALFGDFGMALAVIQSESISREQASTLFWVNISLGFAVFLILAVFSPLIARFFSEPRLVPITVGLASAFIFSSWGTQHLAHLKREMEFARLITIEIVAVISGFVVGVVAALQGLAYWALVLSSVTVPLATTIGAWTLYVWRPMLPVRGSGIRTILGVGRNVTVFNFVNYFARNADNLLIGRFYGASQLGLYTKAYGLMMMPLQQVNAPIAAVALPALSRLKTSTESYQQFYYAATRLIAFITMPLIMFMMVLGNELVLLALGEQWIEVGPIFQVLAVAAFIQPMLNTTGWVYVSSGRTLAMAKWGLIASIALVLSFVAGLPWGTLGVAKAYMIGMYLLLVPGFYICFKDTPLTLSAFAGSITMPFVLSACIGLAAYMVRQNLLEHDPIVVLIACTGASAGVVLIFLLLSSTLRGEIKSLYRMTFSRSNELG